VKEAKNMIRDDLISRNLAHIYSEPADVVVSRSGDECVVCLTDQWFLNYGEEQWRGVTQVSTLCNFANLIGNFLTEKSALKKIKLASKYVVNILLLRLCSSSFCACGFAAQNHHCGSAAK
jgi:leucyl-tRNA synthetase